MKKLLVSTMAAVAAFAMAPAAYAIDYFPGDPGFSVTGNINNGTVSAALGHSGITKGAFSDSFFFVINQNGVGSGSISTSTSTLFSFTDLDISSVTINGMNATKTSVGGSEFFSIEGVPITFGTTNTIVVTGISRGNGSYGGNATFEPSAVPETSTWGMMIVGLGGLGATMRVRRRKTKTAFA